MASQLLSLPSDILYNILKFIPYPERFSKNYKLICKRFRVLLAPSLAWAKIDPHTFKILDYSVFITYVAQFPKNLQAYPLGMSRIKLQAIPETPVNLLMLRTAKLLASQYLLEKHMLTDGRETAFNLYMNLKSRETRLVESRPFHDLLKWGTESMQTAIDIYTEHPPPAEIYRNVFLNPMKVNGTKACFTAIRVVLIADFLNLLNISSKQVQKVFAYLATEKKMRHLFPLESFETSFTGPIFTGLCLGLRNSLTFGGLVGLQVSNLQLQQLCEAIKGKKLEALRLNIIEKITELSFRAIETMLASISATHVEIRYHLHENGEESCASEVMKRFSIINEMQQNNAKIESLKLETCLEAPNHPIPPQIQN